MKDGSRAKIRVSGDVQGVSYRAYALREARRLGLRGWVRNKSDGDVEAVAEGDRETVEAFAAWCRRGSPASRVSAVSVEWGEATGEFDGFEIIQ